MSELNILVIATGYPSKLLETIKKRGHTYTLAKPGDFDLYLSDNPKGFDKVYLFGGRLVASRYDAVITRIGEHRAFASAIIRQLQHNLGIWCLQSGAAIETCADKWKAAQIMSEKHLKVPRQIFSMTGKYPAMYVEKLGNLPILVKEQSGSKGKGLILLETVRTNHQREAFESTSPNLFNDGQISRHVRR